MMRAKTIDRWDNENNRDSIAVTSGKTTSFHCLTLPRWRYTFLEKPQRIRRAPRTDFLLECLNVKLAPTAPSSKDERFYRFALRHCHEIIYTDLFRETIAPRDFHGLQKSNRLVPLSQNNGCAALLERKNLCLPIECRSKN